MVWIWFWHGVGHVAVLVIGAPTLLIRKVVERMGMRQSHEKTAMGVHRSRRGVVSEPQC